MKYLLPLAALLALCASPAIAALPVGAKAPDFTTMGSLNGKPFRYVREADGPGGAQ